MKFLRDGNDDFFPWLQVVRSQPPLTGKCDFEVRDTEPSSALHCADHSPSHRAVADQGIGLTLTEETPKNLSHLVYD